MLLGGIENAAEQALTKLPCHENDHTVFWSKCR